MASWCIIVSFTWVHLYPNFNTLTNKQQQFAHSTTAIYLFEFIPPNLMQSSTTGEVKTDETAFLPVFLESKLEYEIQNTCSQDIMVNSDLC